MRNLIAITLFCFFSLKLFSQDTIVKTDSTIIIGKVLEITNTEISYKELNSSVPTIYIVAKENVALVKYQNGTKDVFNEMKIPVKQETTESKPATLVEKKPLKNHRLSFSVNILPILINERSVCIDYTYKQRHSVGITIGQIFSNSTLQAVRELPGNKDEDKRPGLIYDGIITRINYKYYFFSQSRQYLGLELTYRSASYSKENLSCTQIVHQDNTGENNFNRSEYLNQYGFYFLYGAHLLPVDKIGNIEVFSTIGVRLSYRNYTTYTSTSDFYWATTGQAAQPIGHFSRTNIYPIVTIGLKIGLNVFFK